MEANFETVFSGIDAFGPFIKDDVGIVSRIASSKKNPGQRFGFIITDNDKDVYFPLTCLREWKKLGNSLWLVPVKRADVGEPVTFSAKEDSKGRKSFDVVRYTPEWFEHLSNNVSSVGLYRIVIRNEKEGRTEVLWKGRELDKAMNAAQRWSFFDYGGLLYRGLEEFDPNINKWIKAELPQYGKEKVCK